MPLPTPEEGLVIHYEYLWRHEHERGDETGSKRRPCVIVVAVAAGENGQYEVVVAPITHLEPEAGNGIEIPPRVRKHLGLDSLRQWVITTDLNVSTWPGYDVYPVPNSPPGTWDYGFIPNALFDQIRVSIDAAEAIKLATRRTG